MNWDWLPIKTTPKTLGLAFLLLFILTELTALPRRLDYWLLDSAMLAFPASASPDTVIVAIDDASLSQLGRWPWPRQIHADVISKLHKAGAETIVFDILFTEPTADDTALKDAMQAHGNVILPLHLSRTASHLPLSEKLPASKLVSAASGLGHAHIELDHDGLARGLYLYNGMGDALWPSLALAATGTTAKPTDSQSLPAFLNTRESYRVIPLAGTTGTLPAYSYDSVLNAPPAPGRFSGKTVFIGATAVGLGDILPTPFSGLNQPMPGVEFHANAYSALKQQLQIHRAPHWSGIGLAVITLAFLAYLLPRMRMTYTFFTCVSAGVALLLLYIVILGAFRVWFPIAHALIIPLLAFPIANGLRLAVANRFLSRQLDELARTPGVTLPELSVRSPTQLLEHFQALFQPQGWLLQEDGRILSSQTLKPTDIPDMHKTGVWQHVDNHSWIQLKRGDCRYILGLILPNDLSREAIQLYLQNLNFSDTVAAKQKSVGGENISARIERVKTATERLNHMQEFIRRSFERMPDGIIVTDELGIIRFANGHIENWFGEPMPSVAGLPLTRLLEGHDPRETPPWHETVSETLTLLQSRTVDLRIHHKDFLIHFAPFALPDSTQYGIVANISDISELREQQRQHREAIDFISHDVRSPLVSQLALIEQLKRDPSHIEQSQLEQLGRLAKRSYHLAEEFVQLARAEQLTKTRFYECEFLAIVENARDSVSEQALEKRISLQLHGTEDLWLKGNAELLERAVINLLTNAVQYSPEYAPVNLQVFRAGHQACLTVTDEGLGIEPGELPHLFDRYRRQRNSELAGTRGAGLGLSFVKTVVEKHQGEVYVTSRPGEGSCFTLRLPINVSID